MKKPIEETENLNQADLKKALHYCKETGVFTWIAPRRKINVGDIAGCINRRGYRYIRLNGKLYAAHRLAWLYMTGSFPDEQIDHINHNSQDNSFANIREVSNLENQKNRPMQSNNTSGFTGVYWSKNDNKWLAHIKINGKRKNLGLIEEINHAVIARWMAEDEHGFHPNHGSTPTRRCFRL